jgi:hypothetical protein
MKNLDFKHILTTVGLISLIVFEIIIVYNLLKMIL